MYGSALSSANVATSSSHPLPALLLVDTKIFSSLHLSLWTASSSAAALPLLSEWPHRVLIPNLISILRSFSCYHWCVYVLDFRTQIFMSLSGYTIYFLLYFKHLLRFRFKHSNAKVCYQDTAGHSADGLLENGHTSSEDSLLGPDFFCMHQHQSAGSHKTHQRPYRLLKRQP